MPQQRNFSEKTYHYWQHRILKAMAAQPGFAEISNALKQPTTVAVTVRISEAETAKENGLGPYRYLLWIFHTAPKLFQSDTAWATRLSPALAPAECK